MKTQIVIFNFKWIYYIQFSLFFIVLGSAWSIYYGRGHYKKYDFIPTISETVYFYPENRIFGVGMVINTMLNACIFIFRSHIFDILVIKKNEGNWTAMKVILNILAATVFVSMCLVANVTVVYNRDIHMVVAFTFFASACLYHVLSDIFLSILGRRPSYFSIITTIVGSIVIIIGPYIRAYMENPSNSLKTISSFCQYTSSFCITLKMFLTQFDFPKHGIRFREKNNE